MFWQSDFSVCFSIGDTGKKADGELKRVAGNVQGDDKRIREIRNDMENKKAEVNDIEKPANVILAFSEEDQELMDRIVPALEGRGIQATLVLKTQRSIIRKQ